MTNPTNEVTEAAAAAWRLLANFVGIIVALLLLGFLLNVGLNSAESFGVPDVSYRTAVGLAVGVWGIGTTFNFGLVQNIRRAAGVK